MFPFGSFLTQIPLFIFAALYMLYFGAYALNKSRARKEESIVVPAEKERSFAGSGNSTNTIVLSARNFRSEQKTHQVTESQENTFLFIVPLITERLSRLTSDIAVAGNYNFSLFSRPPPAIY